MQVSLNSQLYPGTTFRNAYMVQGVNVNGKYYGQKKHKALLHNVADELSRAMYRSTLSPKVKKIVNELFPDFLQDPFVSVACSSGEIYEKRINILAGYHAKEYQNVFRTNEDKETQREIGSWLLKRIMNETGNKKIVISVEKNGDVMEITDIQRVKTRNRQILPDKN